jgi:hypothetical protein
VDELELVADCSRCQGLCCVTLAFDQGDYFGFSKNANEPCRHLGATNRCAIHASLLRRGHAGCARYDCYGAGQRVTQLFPNQTWRDGPETARRMFRVFIALQELNELRALLHTAAGLALPEPSAAERTTLLSQLDTVSRASASEISALDPASHRARVHAFLRSLRGSVQSEQRQACPDAPRRAAQLLSLRRK